MSAYNTKKSQKMEQETYDDLHKKHNELKVKFKKQKRWNRKVNRNKYNILREEAANSNAIKEVRKKSSRHMSVLNSKIYEKTNEITNLQEECAYWKEQRQFMYHKYIISFALATVSTVAYLITLKGVENCICE
jgi:hypothetical protein